MVEGDDVIERAVGVHAARRATSRADRNGGVVAIINIVVGIEVVMTTALHNAEGAGKGASVAGNHVVLHGGELGHIGVGVGIQRGHADAHSHGTEIVEGAVLNGIVRRYCSRTGGDAPGGGR